MRYNLGYMDKYPIEATGTVIENNPMYKVTLKTPVNPILLESSLLKAIKDYPLFGTKVMYDKEYYLETNTNPLIITKAKEEDRPLTFGKNTNGYTWQVCYFDNILTFEWLHGTTDGVGAMNFILRVLMYYFDCPTEIANKSYLVAPGLEPFFDTKEKGIDFKNDPEGFSFKKFKKKYTGYTTDCHLLKADTKELLALSNTAESSVAPIIAILFSKAIRMHLPSNMKNRKVACNIVLDLRRSLGYDTMHNCVEYKRITYDDHFDSMSFREVAKEYKRKLDDARLTPNIIKIVTDRIKLFKSYHITRNKHLLKGIVKLIGLVLKDRDCNFVITYPGKIDLPKAFIDQVEDLELKLWHDFGECIIACMDYNGTFNLNISENFYEKGIVEDFIKLSENYGIHWKEVSCTPFTQAHFVE